MHTTSHIKWEIMAEDNQQRLQYFSKNSGNTNRQKCQESLIYNPSNFFSHKYFQYTVTQSLSQPSEAFVRILSSTTAVNIKIIAMLNKQSFKYWLFNYRRMTICTIPTFQNIRIIPLYLFTTHIISHDTYYKIIV